MQFAKRQWTMPWIRHLAAALALALLLGFLGPFNSQQSFDRPTRYGFWAGLTLFGYACILASFVVVAAVPRVARANAAARILVAALLSSVPQALAVAWTLSFLQPGRHFGPTQLADLFLAVLAIQLVFALIAFSLSRGTPASCRRLRISIIPIRRPSPALRRHDRLEPRVGRSALRALPRRPRRFG